MEPRLRHGWLLARRTGLGTVVTGPRARIRELWDTTTEQWPKMCAVLRGVGREQMMARHKANHTQVVYSRGAAAADKALAVKAATFVEIGLHLCGKVSPLCAPSPGI